MYIFTVLLHHLRSAFRLSKFRELEHLCFVDLALGSNRTSFAGVAGIGTRPVIADYMQQIGQTDRRVLATDEWLRVKNTEGVYALGDCASVEQRKIAEDIAYLFKLADVDNDGFLSLPEFVTTMDKVKVRYPQIQYYMERQHMKGVVGLLDEAMQKGKDIKLDIDHFSQAICKVSTHSMSKVKDFLHLIISDMYVCVNRLTLR